MWWFVGYILIGAFVAGVFAEIANQEGMDGLDGWTFFNAMVAWPIAIALGLGMFIAHIIRQER